LLGLSLAGCANYSKVQTYQESAKDDKAISFLLFGDTGYDTRYLKKKQYKKVYPTKEAYIAKEKKDWAEDYRTPDLFWVPPLEYVDRVGGYIASGGLYPVGKAMDSYCKTEECQFAIMTGDNIYPDGATLGADGKDDATRFSELITQPLGFLGAGQEDYWIYSTLGNHDWYTSREGAMAQVEFLENTPPFYMDGLFYRVKPPAANGDVEIFMIDTEVMLAGDTVYHDALNEDGSEKITNEIHPPLEWTKPANEGERNMVQWLDDALRTSDAKWKIVLGHHPIWSTGGSKQEQARTLRKLILPSLCRYADLYVVGHEHTLEIHEDSCETVEGKVADKPLPQIVSGAGAKQRAIHERFKAHQSKKYPQLNTVWTKGKVWGFAHVSLNQDAGDVQMVVTPNNGDGTAQEIFQYQFKHRSN